MDRTLIDEAKKGASGLNRLPVFLSAAFLAVLMVLLPNCGKKGPPFLSKNKLSLKVDQLTGEWKNGRVLLKGYVRDENNVASRVTGCRVYHTWYSMDNPPCEGCPIEMPDFREIREKVVSGHRFNCEVPDIEKKGVHFFEVRLMGKDGAVGPPSDKVKLLIDD